MFLFGEWKTVSTQNFGKFNVISVTFQKSLEFWKLIVESTKPL